MRFFFLGLIHLNHIDLRGLQYKWAFNKAIRVGSSLTVELLAIFKTKADVTPEELLFLPLLIGSEINNLKEPLYVGLNILL